MIQPSSRHRRKPITTATTAAISPTNLKLICRFNGAFEKNPKSIALIKRKVKYVGGDTRIISVNKNINFSDLYFTISQLCPNLHSFSLNYHLSVSGSGLGSESDNDGYCCPPITAGLVSIVSDDDVLCMIREYDKLELYGKHPRLWVYVCSGSNSDSVSVKNSDDDSLRKLVLRRKFSSPLNPIDGNLMMCVNDNRQGSVNCLNGENVMLPLGLMRSLSGSHLDGRLWDGGGGGFKEHARNHFRHPGVGLDGRLVSGSKCCRGLRPKSFISKQGRGFRSSYCLKCKKKSDFIGDLMGGRMSLIHSSLSQDFSSSFHLSIKKSGFAASSFGNLKSTDRHLGCPSLENMACQQDFLTGSPYKPTHEVRNQSVCENYHDSSFISNGPLSFGQQKLVGISDTSGDLCSRNVPAIEGNNEMVDKGVASSIELLDNLSLSSKKGELLAPSLANRDATTSLLKPDSKHLHILEGKLSTGPKADKSNALTSNSSAFSSAGMEQSDTKEGTKCSKLMAGFSDDLTTRQLQTIKNSDLEHIKELGSGTYGTVYYGKWKGSDVVIKRIKPSCFTEGSSTKDRLVADFWKEAHILGQLHHPNIVAFYGIVTDEPTNNLGTVTEYMVNGSLKQVLRRKDRTIDRRKRVILAMDAAFGMEYLHEKNIVHFDLKSDNLLVNVRDPHKPVCKIGDLGLSKIKKRTLVSGGVRGTIPWMAPELLNSKNKMVTEKVDVYSFGIIMWELLTGEEPYADLRSEEIIAGIIKGTLRPEIPSWCDPSWRSLMKSCWASDPNMRPAFSEIAKELREMFAAMNIK